MEGSSVVHVCTLLIIYVGLDCSLSGRVPQPIRTMLSDTSPANVWVGRLGGEGGESCWPSLTALGTDIACERFLLITRVGMKSIVANDGQLFNSFYFIHLSIADNITQDNQGICYSFQKRLPIIYICLSAIFNPTISCFHSSTENASTFFIHRI
jgi:hypothetical protein